MANVSRSVSLSMNNDGSSKHLYDDVFSAPAPARRGTSAFSSRVDDYREIFSPSGASLGSSIPILDLPPLDRSGGFGQAPSSGVDYAGVFGGFRDDDGIGLPSEQMFADLKTKAQREARLPRSRVQIRRLPSKSQEFSHVHGNDQTSAPAQTKTQYSKSQEFPRNIVNNQTSMSPLDTKTPFLKSDNFSGNSPVDQRPATELPQQTVDNVKRFNVSYHKTGQLSKDGANGMTHIARLHAVPGYTHVIDEVGPVRKAAFDKAKTMSMGDADFCLKVGEVSRQGKHTRAASDLGANEREANCKMQNCSTSVSNSPQSFGSDYFKRSSSQRSKRSGSNRESRTKAGSSIPLLDEELDANSSAALSAAAMKRAIEEAEEKILWAKAFLKQLEGNGFIKPTLKDSFRVKAAAGIKHSSEIHGPKENVKLKVKATKKKCINEEIVLKSNGCLNSRPLGETNHANGAVGRRPKDALDVKATSESQLENEVDVLKRRCAGVAAQVDNNMEKSGSFSSPAPETLKTPESLHQRDYFDYKTNSREDLKSPEQVYKSEGGEWEAAKHLSQLISGVKSRLVSFISKQADTERRIAQEAPSKCESMGQSEERVYEVQNTDTKNDRGADQENHKKLVKMNHCTSTVPGVSLQGSDRTTIDVETCEAGQKEVKMYDAASPDTETCTNQQCGRHESRGGLERIEAEVLADEVDYLKQEDLTHEVKDQCLREVREQGQESLSGTVRAEYEKSKMADIGLEEHADMPETTCQSRQFDGIGTSGENDNATVEDVRNLEPVEKGIDDDSFSGGRVNCRRLVGHGWEETKMSNCAEKKQPEDIRMVEETGMMDEDGLGVIEAEEVHDGEDAENIASQNAMSEATEGLIDVVDEDSDHDEYVAEAMDLSKQDQLLDETRETSTHGERGELVKKEGMAESATVAVEPKENVEQHMPVQESKQLIREGTCEQTLCSVEVDEGSKHDERFLAADGMHVQDGPSFSCRDKPHDSIKQCALDEGLSSEKKGLSEPAFSIGTPSSVWMGDESSEKSRSPVEAADNILESAHYVATDDVGHGVCMKNEPPGRNAESHGLDYNNQCPEPEWKFSFEAKIMTTVGNTSEPGGNDEQPGSVKTAGEQMLEASMSAGGKLDYAKNEMEIAGAPETHPGTNARITESETVLDAEQKLSDEAENVATVVTPENEDNEAEFSTSESDANNKFAEQDTKSHDGESPYKRKRWFKSGAEMGEFRLKDQQNLEGSKTEGTVDTQVDEMIGESGVGVHAQAGAVGGQDQESGQSSEGTHRRRRWFESGGEVPHKPIPFDGVAVTEDINNEVKEKKEMDSVVNDQAESKARTEAAHRRRRWFENGEKSGAAQRPSILEENEAATQPKEEKGTVINTARHDERLREKSSTEDLASMCQNEEQSVQREKEWERAAVERAIREARQRAFVEARERAAVGARLKASAAAQERQGKTAVSDKASMDAKIRAERAAVERATAEARERAMNKAMSDNAGYMNQSSGYSTSAVSELPQREKAISERNKRTTERAAKALQEKNMRDHLAQKEQAERNRYADVLDAEVKRWSTGKERNLRSLLSTLQYILGPESGWQPTSLTDLVTTTAVRKAYKRAALCVHPDKLQQRRATVQQKYICEKVFDLLKDAWHRFNPDDR